MAIDQRITEQLKSEDAQERRKAIVALADSRNPDALKLLDEAAKLDDDRKIREIAGKAYQHLKQQLDRAANANAPKPVQVSEKDAKRAKEYVEEAMSRFIAKEKDEGMATRSLTKALQINPALKTDQYFLSVASTVLNMDPQEAVGVLVSGEKRGAFIEQAKNQKVQKRKEEHKSTASTLGWDAMAFDLGIYALVIAAISFLAPFVVSQLVSRTIEYQQALDPEKFAAESIKFSGDLNQLLTVAPGTALIGAIIITVASVIGMLLTCFLIHLIASKLLSGTGTMAYMISQLVPYYSMITVVFFIWFCILLAMISAGAGTFALLCLPIMGLANLVVFFNAAGRVGKAYDFGTAKGCLSLVGASLLLGVVSFVLTNVALQSTISAIMQNVSLPLPGS